MEKSMENMDTDVRVYRVNENPAFTPDDHTIQSEKVLTMFVQQGHSLEEASKWEVKKQ